MGLYWFFITVWLGHPGHSRCLFFCCLFIPSTSACFTYTYSHDWPSYVCTCARPQLVIVLIFRSDHLYLIASQRGGEGRALLLVSLVTNEPTWSLFPSPAPPPRSQDCCHLARQPPHTVGACSRTLLQTCKLHYPSNHRCLCCWL